MVEKAPNACGVERCGRAAAASSESDVACASACRNDTHTQVVWRSEDVCSVGLRDLGGPKAKLASGRAVIADPVDAGPVS